MKQIKILFLTKNPEKIVSILDNELTHCEKLKLKMVIISKIHF